MQLIYPELWIAGYISSNAMWMAFHLLDADLQINQSLYLSLGNVVHLIQVNVGREQQPPSWPA